MFTGIVETTGSLKKIENKNDKVYFTIGVKNFLTGVTIGDSIACDGTCLTVVKKNRHDFTVELMPETLRLTIFSEAEVGQRINLEKAVKIGERLDGHFVTGHVDAVGKVKKIIKEGEYICLEIALPAQLSRFTARKGSAALNGVSLTIAATGKSYFKTCLISHTLAITNLSELKVGSKVNVEVDLIARYLDGLMRK